MSSCFFKNSIKGVVEWPLVSKHTLLDCISNRLFRVSFPATRKWVKLASMLRFHREGEGMGPVYFLKCSRNRGKLGNVISHCNLRFRVFVMGKWPVGLLLRRSGVFLFNIWRY